jgi:uncharacterized protein
MTPDCRPPLPCFVAESTLRKLAKWLRLAGFDTRVDMLIPDFKRLKQTAGSEGRTVLTRTRSVIAHLGPTPGLLIEFNDPTDQVRQVLCYFHIRRDDLRPLSRCCQCNHLLAQVQKERLAATVPDYIRIRHDRFLTCSRCGRVYWPGTHASRMITQIDRWFVKSSATP